ncbi:hypothetical protein DFH07DRAFT_841495 [Mycena maculata]|uniref:Secreted protein n=1 Tax=Mycena maculata TaxID=230809 RepID=A0AAD7I952_9AGAR|nr:hypothetical protein DFH07DRAFT_841495 [Mycena maculata]
MTHRSFRRLDDLMITLHWAPLLALSATPFCVQGRHICWVAGCGLLRAGASTRRTLAFQINPSISATGHWSAKRLNGMSRCRILVVCIFCEGPY